jgi:tight adherence protein B
MLFLSFLVLFGAAVAVWWRAAASKRQKEMMDAIRSGVDPAQVTVKPAVLVEPQGPKVSGFARLFPAFAAASGEDTGLTRGKLIMLTAGSALAGLVLGLRLTGLLGMMAPVIGSVIGVALPTMYQARKARKRLAVIEEQFPEALDCLSRSVRAGNAFSVAIELLGDETSEPLKSEIQKVTREMALGARLEDALHGLIARVPLIEFRFFVSAVLLQRETGGNLSEVIGKLAMSIRERFKLRGQVKASSGQGRITATVLTVLPIATLTILRFTSPGYLNNLTDDPVGRILLGGAVVCQVIGYLVMKRIINIEV